MEEIVPVVPLQGVACMLCVSLTGFQQCSSLFVLYMYHLLVIVFESVFLVPVHGQCYNLFG